MIAVTGSYPETVPERLCQNLKIGGRLFAIVGEAPVMEAMLITRFGDREWNRQELFETDMPMLRNVIKPKHFTF